METVFMDGIIDLIIVTNDVDMMGLCVWICYLDRFRSDVLSLLVALSLRRRRGGWDVL